MLGRLRHIRWASTVNWRPWIPETLQFAKQENKPIFLSSGHHSSHLCRLMELESFRKPDIVHLLNTAFVPIRIDKEKEAGLDTVMMLNLQAQTDGQGGWPSNVFLTPTSASPFIAGSYWSRADFSLILNSVSKEWQLKQSACEEFAASRVLAVQKNMHMEPHTEPIDLQRAVQSASEEYVDMGRSGPRFPMGYSLALLEGSVLDATLNAIAHSGLVDHIEGGVHIYSVSADWHLPNFEKTLSGQATLLLACVRFFERHSIECYPEIKAMAMGLIQCIQQLQGSSSLSGDDPITGAEGGCYLWTADQFHRALQQNQMGLIERDMAEMFWGVNDHGNINEQLDGRGEFYGKNVLSQFNSINKVAEAFGQPASNVEKVILDSRQLLRDFRSKTMPPHTLDPNVVVAWNGLAISALAKVATVFPEIHDAALESARQSAFKLLQTFGHGALNRTIFKDSVACCDDYAYLISGLLDLYAVEKNPEWLRWAAALQTHQIELYIDRKDGAFFYTQVDPTHYIRPKYGHDGALPGYNGVSAVNLIKLANLTGVNELRNMSQRIIDCYKSGLVMQPLGFLSILEAIKTLNI